MELSVARCRFRIRTSASPAQKIPGLTNPALKIELKVPGLKVPAITVPAIKIAQKIPALKIPGVIHKLPEQGPIETDGS